MKKEEIAVTVDSVVFCNVEKSRKVLLIRRKKDPFKDMWAIPGGFLEPEEELEDAAIRELQEETGVKVESMEQVKAFGKPGRDPRGRMISVTFLSRVFSEGNLQPGDDALEAKWWDLENLPDLAFDHKEIIDTANSYL